MSQYFSDNKKIGVAVLVAVLIAWEAIRVRFPLTRGFDKLVWPIVGCIPYCFLGRTITPLDDNGNPVHPRVDDAFTWIANISVALLICVYLSGYFWAAYATNFSQLICAVLGLMVALSAVTGSVFRRYFSRTSLLSYGLSFTVGMLVSLVLLGFLVKTYVPLRKN